MESANARFSNEFRVDLSLKFGTSSSLVATSRLPIFNIPTIKRQMKFSVKVKSKLSLLKINRVPRYSYLSCYYSRGLICESNFYIGYIRNWVCLEIFCRREGSRA